MKSKNCKTINRTVFFVRNKKTGAVRRFDVNELNGLKDAQNVAYLWNLRDKCTDWEASVAV